MNHLLHAVQLYVFGRRASFDFHDVAFIIGAPFGIDELAASNERNWPFSCGVVVLGNSDGLVDDMVDWVVFGAAGFGNCGI